MAGGTARSSQKLAKAAATWFLPAIHQEWRFNIQAFPSRFPAL
jgi:hypothetical protein